MARHSLSAQGVMEVPFFVQFCFYSWLSAGVSVVAHEAAHALAAWLVRFRVMEIRIGTGRKSLRGKLGKCRFHFSLAPLCGWVIAFPRSRRWLRCRMMVFVAAGPLANGIVLWAAWRWLRSTAYNGDPEWMVVTGLFFTLFSAYYLAASLWPAAHKLYGAAVESDGRQLLEIPFYDAVKSSLIVGNFNIFYGVRLSTDGERVRGARWIERGLRCPAVAGQSGEILLAVASLLADGGQVDRARKMGLGLLASEKVPHGSALRQNASDWLACLGIYYGRPDLLADGKEVIDRAIAEYPEAITLKGTLGGILFEMGETEAARTVLHEVLKKSTADVDHAIASAYLAVLAAREGDAAKSQTYAATAAAKNPAHILVKRLLASLPENHTAGGSGTSK